MSNASGAISFAGALISGPIRLHQRGTHVGQWRNRQPSDHVSPPHDAVDRFVFDRVITHAIDCPPTRKGDAMAGPKTATGWCTDAKHDRCDGLIRAGTGWNWWCTCACHPEPTIPTDRPDFERALEFWKNHRS